MLDSDSAADTCSANIQPLLQNPQSHKTQRLIPREHVISQLSFQERQCEDVLNHIKKENTA